MALLEDWGVKLMLPLFALLIIALILLRSFDLAVIILFSLAFLFFVIFFFLCRAWAKPMHPERRNIIALAMSTLYVFWFLLVGFIIIVAVNLLIWLFLPYFRGVSF